MSTGVVLVHIVVQKLDLGCSLPEGPTGTYDDSDLALELELPDSVRRRMAVDLDVAKRYSWRMTGGTNRSQADSDSRHHR